MTTLSFSQTEIKEEESIHTNKIISRNLKKITQLYKEYDYKKALDLSNLCIEESRKINNDSLLGWSYLMKGVVEGYLNNREEALKNQKKAQIIFKRISNHRGIGATYNNIAFTYVYSGDNLDSTIVYYKKALTAFKHLDNNLSSFLTLVNLAEEYIKLNDLKEAKLYLKKANLLTKTNNEFPLSNIYLNYALIYDKEKEYHKALEYLKLSEKEAKKENEKYLLADIYKLKSSILRKLGKLKESHSYFKKYDDKLKIVHKIEKSKLIQKAAVKFEVKEKKILLEKTKLENQAKKNELKKSKQIVLFIILLILISIVASILLIKNNVLKIENNKLLIIKNEELKDLQYKTELNFLKNQVQPDFFFKTLSTLHTLIAKKAKNAKDVVIKLSDLMQYSIYESIKESVPLKNEIENIKSYLEIYSIDHKSEPIILEKKGNLKDVMIPPLLYFSLIENYFNYININQNTKLSIYFKNLDDKKIQFNIECVFCSKKNNTTTKKFKLQKTKRRLELLYKGAYELNILSREENHSVSLIIPYKAKHS